MVALIRFDRLDQGWITPPLIHLKFPWSFYPNRVIHDPLRNSNPCIWVTCPGLLFSLQMLGSKVDHPLDHLDQGGDDPFPVLLHNAQHIDGCRWLDHVDHPFSLDSVGKGKNYGEPGLLLVGKPLKPGAINLLLRRLAKRAGITRRVNPHSIRHLIGQLYTDRTNLALAKEKLNHASIVTTGMIYAHQDTTRVKAATDLYSPLNEYLPQEDLDQLFIREINDVNRD